VVGQVAQCDGATAFGHTNVWRQKLRDGIAKRQPLSLYGVGQQ
jgi:hypothetical protein